MNRGVWVPLLTKEGPGEVETLRQNPPEVPLGKGDSYFSGVSTEIARASV